MIKQLFGKFLLSCDSPRGCQKYLHLKGRPEDADRVLKENGWQSFSVGNKIMFLCGQCQGKLVDMTKPEWEKMKTSATPITK